MVGNGISEPSAVAKIVIFIRTYGKSLGFSKFCLWDFPLSDMVQGAKGTAVEKDGILIMICELMILIPIMD